MAIAFDNPYARNNWYFEMLELLGRADARVLSPPALAAKLEDKFLVNLLLHPRILWFDQYLWGVNDEVREILEKKIKLLEDQLTQKKETDDKQRTFGETQ